MNKIELAKHFANEKHALQKYGAYPYAYHLNMVYSILKVAGIVDEDILAAAYLHDILEDTNVTYQELENLFGKDVAVLVETVTGRGINRKSRVSDFLVKIKLLESNDKVAAQKAASIKLADRLANFTETCNTNNVSLRSMYIKEWKRFSSALHGLGDESLWVILINLIKIYE